MFFEGFDHWDFRVTRDRGLNWKQRNGKAPKGVAKYYVLLQQLCHMVDLKLTATLISVGICIFSS